jgi:hypothetical protein
MHWGSPRRRTMMRTNLNLMTYDVAFAELLALISPKVKSIVAFRDCESSGTSSHEHV